MGHGGVYLCVLGGPDRDDAFENPVCLARNAFRFTGEYPEKGGLCM